MTAMRKSKLRRRNGRSKKSTAVFILVSSLLGLCLLLTLVSHFWLSSIDSNTDGSGSTLNLHRLNGGNAKKIHNDIGNGNVNGKGKGNGNGQSNSEFVATLNQKKILFDVTTVGQFQYAYFEHVLDSVRDLCEAGSHVDLHITTSNCNPTSSLRAGEDCALYDQDRAETLENNYPVEKIDQLNERLRCRNPEGSLTVQIHLISPDWGKQVVDNHRRVFYDNIDGGYDVFVHSEEDETIRPTNILSFMDETEKLRKLVGDERLPDYSIGFVRYENQMEHLTKRRVVWEFEWTSEVEDTIDHPDIQGRYFSSPPWHHQGMFMATREQLIAWKRRGPLCLFDKPVRRHGYHRERTSGAMDLYDKEYCNVTQLLPLDSMEDFYIHHMPDKNNHRQPGKVIATMDLHKRRMAVLLVNDSKRKLWADTKGRYNGINMFVDEKNETASIPFDLTNYKAYVKRGGMLNQDEIQEWDWSDEKKEE